MHTIWLKPYPVMIILVLSSINVNMVYLEIMYFVLCMFLQNAFFFLLYKYISLLLRFRFLKTAKCIFPLKYTEQLLMGINIK